ncbi:chaperonin 10-like protein [Aspergillus spectabilis]
MTVQKRTFIFKKIPTGWPIPGADLAIEERQIDLLNNNPPPGSLIAKLLYASLDPYMRGKMRDASTSSYTPAYTLNDPITAYSLAKVLNSNHPNYRKGDIIFTRLNIEEYTS